MEQVDAILRELNRREDVPGGCVEGFSGEMFGKQIHIVQTLKRNCRMNVRQFLFSVVLLFVIKLK